MATQEYFPVIIIGGGIVGLSASLFLSSHNISHLLIERHAGTSIHPRARGINTRAMEIFHSIQIDEAVIEAGSQLAPSMGFCVGNSFFEVMNPRPRKEGKRGGMPLAKFYDGVVSPVKGARCTLDLLEPVLVKTARERGGELRFYTECETFEQNEKGVTITVRDREKDTTSTIHSDYLIAADGAGSPIRSRLGISITGAGPLGNLINILFRADLASFVKGREISLCYINRPDDLRGIFTAINNSDIWVFHLCYDPSKGEKASDYPPERCKELLKVALGILDIEIEIKSILPWQPSDIAASKLQSGRIFLAGDAAHQTTPYAGQGATTGISDVWDLSWKLASVLKGQATPKLLETYEMERLPVAKFVAHESGVITNKYGLPSIKYGVLTFALNGARRIAMYSGFGYRYTSGAFIPENVSNGWLAWWNIPWTIQSLVIGLNGAPGTRAPHVWVQFEGRRISTLDLFGKSFVLLAGSEGKEWCRAAEAVKERMNLDLVAYRVGPTGKVSDPKKLWEYAAGITAKGALLVRPDGFVGWRVQDQQEDLTQKLESIMARILCR